MKNKTRFSKAWVPIGPEWKTTDTFQIRELLRGEQIAFKMLFSDMFFTSIFHLPAEDKRWSILVRRKDRERTVALLAQEGLIRKDSEPDGGCVGTTSRIG